MSVEIAPAIFLELAEGVVTFELYWDYARRTCENLVAAVEDKLWEGKRLRRHGLLIVAEESDAAFGPIGEGHPPPELSHSGAGLLTCPIADSGAWGITLGPVPSLDEHSVIAGRIASGMGVFVRSLSTDPVIKSMRIEKLPVIRRPTPKVL